MEVPDCRVRLEGGREKRLICRRDEKLDFSLRDVCMV